MPSSIPYDPSLVLGSVVNEQALSLVEQVSALNAPVDAAQDSLNSLIASKRSLDFTQNEVQNLGVSTTALTEEIEKLKAQIDGAAANYAKSKMAAEPQISKLKEQIRVVHSSVESPIDYMKTEIKTMPLAADTMNMDVQYFSLDSNAQDGSTYAGAISSYVAASAQVLGVSASSKMSQAAQEQVSRQLSSNNIAGTLVLSVTCTHKNANVLAPFIIHIDKAIEVWNRLFPDKLLDPTSRKEMLNLANKASDNKQKFSLISGVTYGSSFVGMVHVLKTTNSSISDAMTATAASLQAQMRVGSWFENASGGFGVNSSFSDDVKHLLSQQNITSHVTLISMGVIPSMVSNEVQIAVDKFAQFDPKTSMDAVAKLQNNTVDSQTTVDSGAESARSGEMMTQMQNSKIEACLAALDKTDDGKNKILDITSMMTALEDYLKKAADMTGGVPINYYTKDINIKMLAEMWVAKYFPGEFMAIKFDDSEGAGPATKTAGGDSKAKL